MREKNEVKGWRIMAGFKRAEDAAAEIGCSIDTIYQIENGRMPLLETAEKMAAAYGVPFEKMIAACRSKAKSKGEANG